jgi:hypothetical protein
MLGNIRKEPALAVPEVLKLLKSVAHSIVRGWYQREEFATVQECVCYGTPALESLVEVHGEIELREGDLLGYSSDRPILPAA